MFLLLMRWRVVLLCVGVVLVTSRTDPRSFGRRQGDRVRLVDTATDCDHTRGFQRLRKLADDLKKQKDAVGEGPGAKAETSKGALGDLFQLERQPALGRERFGHPDSPRFSSRTCTGQVGHAQILSPHYFTQNFPGVYGHRVDGSILLFP